MPTYEYICDACEHQFEEFQSITAAALRKCPSCGKLKLRRLIGTGAGILFKGSGFYETDYRSDSYRKAAKADAPATKSDSAAKADAKPASSDSKPAATSGKAAPTKSAASD